MGESVALERIDRRSTGNAHCTVHDRNGIGRSPAGGDPRKVAEP